ncbi:MAG: serine protease [Elusimicrobiaceae bacterium]|nr:serine protease [Elusimicrobiaceae bacterium]
MLPAWGQNDHVRIARENSPAVVAINVAKKDGSTFTGTGFVVTPDGLIATNKHVVQDAIFTNVTFNTGIVSGEAIKMATADKVDLTLLKIEARNLPYAVLGDSDTVLPGQTITVIGNPRRLQNTISSGLISQVRQKEDGTLWHQISAPISPSSSGSPVFNAKGEVVCVAFASYNGEGDQNLNFAVPVNYLRQLITEAGFSLPQTTLNGQVPVKENPILAHLKKSWSILMRLIKRNSDEK